MPCLNCGGETTNPKFCSRNCAATYNNKLYPKRQRISSCSKCKAPVHSGHKFCSDCWSKTRVLDLTLNSNDGKNAGVRQHARAAYKKSGRPYTCAICKYSTHVDICHIKDIRTYPDETSYSVINDQANLLALCKNHHWEFDHDVL
jgi:hypothetical protein